MKNTSCVLEPGLYWIGDLWHMLQDNWDEVCRLTIVGKFYSEGKFKLKDGRTFVSFNTFYGDGAYTDNEGRVYDVESGCLGCIKYVHNGPYANDPQYGAVIEFPTHFMVCNDNGRIKFGPVIIDTIIEEIAAA